MDSGMECRAASATMARAVTGRADRSRPVAREVTIILSLPMMTNAHMVPASPPLLRPSAKPATSLQAKQ